MKKLLFLLLLLPTLAFAQIIPPVNDSTAIGTPGAAYTPSFRTVTYGGKNLFQVRIGTSAKWMTLSTTQYNRNYLAGAQNGLTKLDSIIELGGDLIKPTTINANGFNFSVLGEASGGNSVTYFRTQTLYHGSPLPLIGLGLNNYLTNKSAFINLSEGHVNIQAINGVKAGKIILDDDSIHVGGKMMYDVAPIYTNPLQFAAIKDVTDKSTTFVRSNISLATPTNTRKDQSAIIRLSNGYLAIAYSNFNTTAGDTGASSIYYQISKDEGVTWEAASELIPQISIGSYIPSFYKKANGNILCVFFVRETVTPSYTSTLRQIEFSGDLQTIITPETTILSGGYFAVGSDRLFYDDATGRLLMPYPTMVGSDITVTQGKMLVSTDEGATWSVSAITLPGVLNSSGIGGVMEPGIFKKETQLVYYFRTNVNSIYAYDLTASGSTYTVSSVYNIGIKSTGAMSTIKWLPLLDIYVAAYTRLNELSVLQRKVIDLSISSDGKNWGRPIQVVNAGTKSINEPGLFFNDKTSSLIVPYSFAPTPTSFDLLSYKIPYSSLVGLADPKTWTTLVTNPLSDEHIELSSTDATFSKWVGNRLGSVIRSYLTLTNDIDTIPSSFYGLTSFQQIKSASTRKKLKLSKLVNFSTQNILNNVEIGNYRHINVNGFGAATFPTTSIIDTLIAVNVENMVASGAGTANTKIAFKQDGTEDINIFMGNTGIGRSPSGYKFDVLGDSRFNGLIVKSGGLATQALMADGSVKLIGNIDNTSDLAKPVSTATTAAINALTLQQVTTAGGSTDRAIKITGQNAVPTGSGMELFYTGTSSQISSYNRTGAAYLPLNINGLTTTINNVGGNVMLGTLTNDGVNKLQIQGTIRATGYSTGGMLVNDVPGNITSSTTLPTVVATAERAATATLTNKTLTSPVLTTVKPASTFQTPIGTAGTDSVVVKTSLGLRAISPTYYGVDANNVHKTGTETVGGLKTFTSFTQFDAPIGMGTTVSPQPVVWQASASWTTSLYAAGNGTSNTTLYLPTSALPNDTLAKKSDFIKASSTLDFTSTAAQTSSELTITVTGASDGDVVSLGVPNVSTSANSCFTARVSATNTVTVKFNNYSSGSIDPASGTFKVTVFK